VNLSDLAAMGAQPAWCTLSLSLPHADEAWVDAFLDGFLALSEQHDVALVGGDTTRGPLSICVTVHGLADPDGVLRRDAAHVGDDIWVTGTLGDAGAALVQLRAGGAADTELRARLDRPTPRIAIARMLAAAAHACIDLSDGLLADLGHVCTASGVGAIVELDALPASPMLAARFNSEARQVLQASGGDDYELCFTAAPMQRDAIAQWARVHDVAITRIGRIVAGETVNCVDAHGQPWHAPRSGYVHFAD